MEYVEVMVAEPPMAMFPTLQGKGVAHAPVLETKARPAGVGSVTVTPAAAALPLLETLVVYVTVCPGVTDAGPPLVTWRSAVVQEVLAVEMTCRRTTLSIATPHGGAAQAKTPS